MASNFLSTQTYTTPPSSQINLTGGNQNSPIHSVSGTPTNVSPTSPQSSTIGANLPLANRQLRPPKKAMFIPAALRPTERPQRQTPPTPPRSTYGSLDSLDALERPGSRRSTGSTRRKRWHLGPLTEDKVFLGEGLGEVIGPPTREHWKPDANASICDSPVCQKSFNVFERRHHCRRCGHVFCNTHSHYSIPLDQDAEFHPAGNEVRACKHCWEQYCDWETARRSKKAGVKSAPTTAPATPAIGVIGENVANKDGQAPEAISASTSAPQAWHWSTF